MLHTGMARKVLVAWYAKLLGVQYIADPHCKIIGVRTTRNPQDRRLCKIAFNLSPDTKKRLLKLTNALVRLPSCLSLSPDSKN